MFDENIFNPDLFKGASKPDDSIVAIGLAPEELVVKKRSQKAPGEELSRVE